MKRSLIVLLLVIVFAGLTGTLIARDPGYVLIAYGGYSVQSSLWVMLVLSFVLIIAVIIIMRLVHWLVTGSDTFKNWRGNRKVERAHSLTATGMTLLATGDYARAEKYLISGAENHENPGVNFLAAARAADAQANGEQREALLRLAVDTDRKLADAASITAAELALQRGDWQRCLSSLEGMNETDLILGLKRKALVELQNWTVLADMMPALRRTDADLTGLNKQIALARLSAPEINDEERAGFYKKLTRETRQEKEVILACVKSIQDESAAEAILRQAVKAQWQPELVLMYGKLGMVTLSKRIKNAEAWLKKHNDAELYLALAIMYRMQEDTSKAREFCQKSIDLASDPDAHELMGSILADEGDYAGSNEFLKCALAHQP